MGLVVQHRRRRVAQMANLDERYPHLSELVRSVLTLSLDALASRAPCDDYPFYDLERLLANVRDNDYEVLDEFGSWFAQARGYLATIDAYVGLGVIENRRRFLVKKLSAPRNPSNRPVSAEMLDTLVECSWGLWLHEMFGAIQEGKVLPSGARDADFYVNSGDIGLWVDCISVTPEADQPDLGAYFSKVARNKWRKKFGHRQDQGIATALAVTVIKNQEYIVPFLRYHEQLGSQWAPETSLWNSCPSLKRVWFGMPPWHEDPQQPAIFGTWESPKKV